MSNENINRDENAHSEFAAMIYRRHGAGLAVEAEVHPEGAVEAINEEERQRQRQMWWEEIEQINQWEEDHGFDPRRDEDGELWGDEGSEEEVEYLPLGPELASIGLILYETAAATILENGERDENGQTLADPRRTAGDQTASGALIRKLTSRFAGYPVDIRTCVNCCSKNRKMCACLRGCETLVPRCTFCCDRMTNCLLPPCDEAGTDICDECKKDSENYPIWMQMQYMSFGPFRDTRHAIDLGENDDSSKICVDQCILCDECNTEKIGFAWFPRSVRDEDGNDVFYPLKVVMCGGCYIKYNTSPIGREITIAKTSNNGNWADAAAILFRDYVYDHQRSVEGLFLCINFTTGWGNGLTLPNEIILKIFGYAWQGYFYERRRDIKREREEEEEKRKIAKLNLELAYIRYQRSLGRIIKLEEREEIDRRDELGEFDNLADIWE